MDRSPHHDQSASASPEEVDPPQPIRPRAFRTRLTASVPGAVAGVFLVCALAFGATLQTHVPPVAPAEGTGANPAVDGTSGSSTLADHESFDRDEPGVGDHPGSDIQPRAEGTGDPGTPIAEPTPSAEPTPTDTPRAAEPTARPTEKPEPKATAKPEPTPTEKPATTEPPALGLTVAVKDGAIDLGWSACTLDGADYYKIVRSTDERITWPAGDGDTLIAAIEPGGPTAARDEHAPVGSKVWYRVFCVRHTADGYRVLTASPVRGVTTPAEAPAPSPHMCGLSLEVGLDGGHAVLHWTACTSDQFSHYRIVRTIGDTSTVVAELESQTTNTWVDESVETGGTYAYQVQAKGVIDGSYVLLGSTDVVAVTIG